MLGAPFSSELRELHLRCVRIAHCVRVAPVKKPGKGRIFNPALRLLNNRHSHATRMKPNHAQARIGGFTIVEGLVCVVVVTVMAAVILPTIIKHNTKAARVSCINHLKQIGLGFRMWSNDNDEKFPWDVPIDSRGGGGTKDLVATGEAWRHFQAISNELNTPKVLVCPNEKERTRVTDFATLNDSHLSYFVGLSADETKPQTILSGDRNLVADGKLIQGRVAITTNAILGWASFNHLGYGNTALADGSAYQTTPESVNKQLQAAFLSTTQSVLRFAFPQ